MFEARYSLFMIGFQLVVWGGLTLLFLYGGLLTDDPNWWAGLLAAIVCAIPTYVFVKLILNRRVQARADANGFYWRHWSERPIAWSDLVSVRQGRAGHVRMLAVRVRNADAYPPAHPLLRKMASKQLRAQGIGAFSVMMINMDRRLSDLAAAIRQHRPDLFGGR